MPPLRILVVGAGPAGCYTIDALLKSKLPMSIDVIDARPLPFGLLRNGVAPDHGKIKNLQSYFERILFSEHVEFYGNVHLGKDLALADLEAAYHAVFVCTGSQSDRQHPRVDYTLPNCSGSRDVVAWYNGFPTDEAMFSPANLGSRIAIVGMGNVSLDIARIFLKSPTALASTEMPAPCILQLQDQAISDIHILVRRGPAQVRCTPLELEELLSLPDINIRINAKDLQLSDTDKIEVQENKTTAKNIGLLNQVLSHKASSAAKKTLHLHFYSAISSLSTEHTSPLLISRNQTTLSGPAHGQTAVPNDTPLPSIEADSIITSIGYTGKAVDTLAFNSKTHCIQHDSGRIQQGKPGHAWIYASGWIKRGAQGVIGTNKRDAADSVALFLADLNTITNHERLNPAFNLSAILKASSTRYISSTDAKQCFMLELQSGKGAGKPRLKYTQLSKIIDCLEQRS